MARSRLPSDKKMTALKENLDKLLQSDKIPDIDFTDEWHRVFTMPEKRRDKMTRDYLLLIIKAYRDNLDSANGLVKITRNVLNEIVGIMGILYKLRLDENGKQINDDDKLHETMLAVASIYQTSIDWESSTPYNQ